jgi:basic amino acid/polyamine antiporter, APA family
LAPPPEDALPPASGAATPAADAGLVRGLSAWDGALLTIGSVVGTGIFITTGDIARVLPSAGWIMAVWLVGGLLTLAGALTYAELGALYPRAGGLYHFLKEAYSPLWGFLYGWASFLVIMSGGIAALAVGFGEYLGSFFPFFSTRNVLVTVPLGDWTWRLSGGQLAAAAAILVLTAINYLGLREGAVVQNALTVVKVAAIVLFAGVGFLVPQPVPGAPAHPLPPLVLPAAFGVGMIAVLWTYDGWYGLTFSAGEVRNPARSLPLGLIGGTLAVMALYALLNLVYLRALPVGDIAATPRIGEAAAAALFGHVGGRLVALAVVVSTLGCLSATILYSSRIYLPMARDGVFFRSLAAVHPRHHVPGRSLWSQSLWAMVLALSGSYDQLYTYTVFAAVLFHVATGAAVFVLRRRRPELPRPYRVWGYPVVPALFLLASGVLVVNTAVEKPVESLLGLGLVALGVPAYFGWRRRRPPSGSPPASIPSAPEAAVPPR